MSVSPRKANNKKQHKFKMDSLLKTPVSSMRGFLRFGLAIVLFVFLTLLTQIGGILYLATLLVVYLFPSLRNIRYILFPALYLIATFLLVPPLANAFSERVPLPCFEQNHLKSQSILYCVLNRNYVKPQLLEAVQAMAIAVDEKFPGTVTQTLDGNFPFLDGFPLLPHLSHKDGKKLDIAFSYSDMSGNYCPKETASPIGYWHFSRPRTGETSANCDPSRKNLRWDMEWFQIFNDDDLILDTQRTAYGLHFLIRNSKRFGISRILLEPHLIQRFELDSNLVKFQGCHAARHDDHFHFQII